MTKPEITLHANAVDNRKSNEDEGHKNGGCGSKAACFFKNITVEPLLGLVMLSIILSTVTTQNLNLQKSCRANLKIADFVCDALERKNATSFNETLHAPAAGRLNVTVLDAMRFGWTSFNASCFNATAHQHLPRVRDADRDVTLSRGRSTDDVTAILDCFEKQTQSLVVDMTIWQNVIQNTVPCILVVFVGSWSDRNKKRKVFMLLPILGELVRNLGLIACVYFFNELPVEVAGIVESVPESIAGYLPVLLMAVFAHVGDVTTVENRTIRVGIVCLVSSISFPVGAALSGILYRGIGYYGIYSLSITLYLVSFIYGALFIKDAKQEVEENYEEPKVIVLKEQKSGLVNEIFDFFNLKHVKEAFRITFNKGDKTRRTTTFLLLIIIFILLGPLMGEQQNVYFLTRIRYNWDEVKFSIYLTFNSICNLIGIGFTLCVLVNKFHLDDRLIGALGCLSKGLAGFVYAFAPNEYVFYLAPIIDIFHGAALVASRSILSKLVPACELGQVLAVFSIMEALVPVIFRPLYSIMYKKTYETFPGAFFFFGGVVVLPGVIIFLWMYRKLQEKCVFVEEKQSLSADYRLKDDGKIR